MNKKTYLYAGGALLSACAIASYRQNHVLDVSVHSFDHDKLPSAFEGFRILHISDLHDAKFGRGQRSLLKEVKVLQPDVVFLSGDMIDRRKTNERTIRSNYAFIEGITKIAPVYYVPGNHEATSGMYAAFKQYMLDHGVHVLENSKTEISRENQSITLLGLKDPRFYSYDSSRFEENLHHLCAMREDNTFCMLLTHRPEAFPLYAQYGIDLCFCGHAHGGQVRLPKLGGLYAPDQGLMPYYTSGLYQVDSSSMIISRGLGNSRAPQRVNNHPELILITLHKK